MAENRRGKENRFYFSRGQMFMLGAAFTLAAVIIFFLGMFVGAEIEARKIAKKEEPLVKIPLKVGKETAGNPAQAKEEISFNAAPSESGGASAPAEEKSKAPGRAEKPAAGNAREVKAPARSETVAARTQQTAELKAPAPEASKTQENGETVKEQNRIWRAQVNAYPDERSAKQIVDRLKNKGYNAYVTEVQNKGKTWFRVSVGKYGSREEAEKTVEILKAKENFPKAFAASR